MSPVSAERKPRGPYASPRQEARQRRILESTRQEITRVGYDALTMQQLAKAGDVSTKTLYNLFGSKDELLLAAVADLLGNLEQHPSMQAAGAGVPALLAFTELVGEQILETPRYAEVMARALFHAEQGHRLIEILLGNTVRVAENALVDARSHGQVDPELDVGGCARVLAAHQWGVVLLWAKGLIPLEEYRRLARNSQICSLLPICRGDTLQRLQAQY